MIRDPEYMRDRLTADDCSGSYLPPRYGSEVPVKNGYKGTCQMCAYRGKLAPTETLRKHIPKEA